MTPTGVATLTVVEARRLVPEATAAMLTGESLADAMIRAELLSPVCDMQCRWFGGCGHADHKRLSEWLSGCLASAAPTNRTAAMCAVAECQEILRTEEAT